MFNNPLDPNGGGFFPPLQPSWGPDQAVRRLSTQQHAHSDWMGYNDCKPTTSAPAFAGASCASALPKPRSQDYASCMPAVVPFGRVSCCSSPDGECWRLCGASLR